MSTLPPRRASPWIRVITDDEVDDCKSVQYHAMEI
jgi:hypothetical protein